MSEQIKRDQSPTLPTIRDYESMPPDNTFFEDAITGEPCGQSWNIEIGGIEAKIGRIEPGTSATYRIEEAEFVLIQKGIMELTALSPREWDHRRMAHIESGRHLVRNVIDPGTALALPIKEEFTFEVVEGEALEYVCFYPKYRRSGDVREPEIFNDIGEFVEVRKIAETNGFKMFLGRGF
ncbi:MAG: hypothetical protein AAB914_02375 [Patescibacteria group bacterium]